MLGDEYVQDAVVGLAAALADPQLASAGLDAQRGSLEGEETLARRLAAEVASSILRQRGAQQAPTPTAPTSLPRESLAGLGERRKFEAVDKARRATPKLFGKGAATA